MTDRTGNPLLDDAPVDVTELPPVDEGADVVDALEIVGGDEFAVVVIVAGLSVACQLICTSGAHRSIFPVTLRSISSTTPPTPQTPALGRSAAVEVTT